MARLFQAAVCHSLPAFVGECSDTSKFCRTWRLNSQTSFDNDILARIHSKDTDKHLADAASVVHVCVHLTTASAIFLDLMRLSFFRSYQIAAVLTLVMGHGHSVARVALILNFFAPLQIIRYITKQHGIVMRYGRRFVIAIPTNTNYYDYLVLRWFGGTSFLPTFFLNSHQFFIL